MIYVKPVPDVDILFTFVTVYLSVFFLSFSYCLPVCGEIKLYMTPYSEYVCARRRNGVSRSPSDHGCWHRLLLRLCSPAVHTQYRRLLLVSSYRADTIVLQCFDAVGWAAGRARSGL